MLGGAWKGRLERGEGRESLGWFGLRKSLGRT
jgi:hypothetical protein